ncbi:putative bifunctional diguanylate cyclase/phosphodiesterase [Paeniglutamicibacter sp.]|uniref:putative bifunctional diguanylate cyclase/phosphodiesterase n=1 Tax=Paeniglutamicibacter sp. TaxID=1934391 RepID=UPI00398A4F56
MTVVWQAPGADPRIRQIVDAILRIADMDFGTLLQPSRQRDEIDAIIVGINAMVGELQGAYSTLDRRVSERTHMLEIARDNMTKMAYTDQLTQLANRSALVREVDSAIEGIGEGQTAPILLLLDLDAFKSINDTYGHDMGDKMLRNLAARLSASVRSEDFVARLGGDEFAVLIPMPEHGAMEIGQRIVSAMNEIMIIDGIHLSPSASLGMVRAEANDAADQLLIEADTAMYVAKRSNTEKVVEFEPYMLHERRQRAQMITDLQSALGNNEFIPVYQGLHSLDGEGVLGAEALVRWQRKGHGLIGPGEFLHVAEESGMIGQLTECMLHRSLADLAGWRALGIVDAEFKVHLNVTSRELHHLGFPDLIRAALRLHDLPANVLALEITENRLMSGDNLHQYTLLALRNMGVEVFIDDFGTGYSSISYLRQLPVAGVKIDRSLVQDIAIDTKPQRFLRAIFDLINACDLQCVVEGVETSGQSDQLKAMGFGTVQGFLYGRPLEAKGFAEVLRQCR